MARIDTEELRVACRPGGVRRLSAGPAGKICQPDSHNIVQFRPEMEVLWAKREFSRLAGQQARLQLAAFADVSGVWPPDFPGSSAR